MMFLLLRDDVMCDMQSSETAKRASQYTLRFMYEVRLAKITKEDICGDLNEKEEEKKKKKKNCGHAHLPTRADS